ncbi:hypothetical protein NDU88_003559 [Pleurodeles waltl]|uniref:Putative nuclease HARBI1 n=1 Tax=Pleurodeles waltl TaxID=8319 RepID=A0AAV7UYR8_PLEWA|nr:hypothetical protein NDU88_003559 [Pleurodeles waltl]
MLASGSFQTTGALVGGISQPSFSAFLPKVLDAIIGLTPRHICFPNTLQKQQETKQGFYLISGFPRVLGAIDCTHVCLVPPAATEHLYLNRKHTHSINVQAIVDHQGLINNIVAKYPGSVHDSYIFRHCTINEHFQDGRYGNGLLVADQGYGIQPWIMTPFGNPSTAAERAYNDAHRRTRSIVERTFRILKSRFRCLNITGGSLLYSPEMVCGPAPYTVGEVATFEDPDHSTANMTPDQVREFQRRAMRYQHILLVESGFRRMARRYRHERASGAWRAFPQGGPTLPTQPPPAQPPIRAR